LSTSWWSFRSFLSDFLVVCAFIVYYLYNFPSNNNYYNNNNNKSVISVA